MARCLGRLDLVERVLSRFEDALGGEVEQLEAALAEADVDAVATIAHRIKGSSLTVSATELGRVAADLETTAPTGDTVQLEAGVAAVKQEWGRVQDALPSISPKTTS